MALNKASNSMIEGAPVNVKDFGAVGDGVTDDTAAIQAALDSVGPNGGQIVVPVGTYKITGRITITRSNTVLYVYGSLVGNLPSTPQPLIEISASPQAIGSSSYIEPSTALENIHLIIDGGTIDYGPDNTSFVYDYANVQNYWTYHTIFIDRCINLEITGKGNVKNGLISNIFTRKVQNGYISDLTVNNTVWDNGLALNTALNTGARNVNLPADFNSIVVERCISKNSASYGFGAFNVMDVTFNDCLAYQNLHGFSVETPDADRASNSFVKFINCKSIGNTAKGFNIDAFGTKLTKCYASGNEDNVVISKSQQVYIDIYATSASRDNIFISQNSTTYFNEVTISGSSLIEYAGRYGIYARGVREFILQDGAKIENNTDVGLYLLNSGGSAYDEGAGRVYLNKAIIHNRTRIEYMDIIDVKNTTFKESTATIVILRNNNIVIMDYPTVLQGGSATLGVEITSNTRSFYSGMVTDVSSPFFDTSSTKTSLTREGLSDASGWTDSNAQTAFNSLLTKLRRGGILNR